jgi:hypothetical protein
MTDNHLGYKPSAAARAAIEPMAARQTFIKPHCPWQNGKVEMFNRALQIEWAYRRIFHSNAERAADLAPGCSSTTLNDDTPPSVASRRSADCHQPDDRVHLDPAGTNGQSPSQDMSVAAKIAWLVLLVLAVIASGVTAFVFQWHRRQTRGSSSC